MSLAHVSDRSQRVILGAAGVAVFMATLALIDEFTRGAVNLPALGPPFGASVVIVFFTPDNPAGKPWNVIVGHLVPGRLQSMAELSRTGRFRFPYGANVYVARVSDYFWWENHRPLPIWYGFREVNASLIGQTAEPAR